MKTTKLLTGAFALLVLILGAGCEKDAADTAGKVVFELSDTDGDPSEAVQTLLFGDTKNFPVTAKNIVKTSILSAPQGWDCEVSISKRQITVTAPDAADLEADANGEIVVKALNDHSSATVTLRVAVRDGDVTIDFKDDLTSPREFRYGEECVLTFAAVNVARVDVTAPKGWTVDADLSGLALTVTAPALAAQDAEIAGDIVVTPYSKRGNAGGAAAFGVKVLTEAPVVALDAENAVFDFGAVRTVTATTLVNTVEWTVKSAPEGWTVTPDLVSKRCEITAPAASAAGYEAAGEVVLTATSASGHTTDAQIGVSLRGIGTADEFVAFGKAVAAGADLAEYTNGGIVLLLADIDLSTYANSVFVGASDKPFEGVFEGLNHLVTLKINATDDAGLFRALGAGGVIRNLRVTGSISAAVNGLRVGSVVVTNRGGRVENVVSSVAFTSTGNNSGYYGGIAAESLGNGAVYRNCRSTGTVYTTGIKYFGGLIGCIDGNTTGEITDCSNSGSITLDYKQDMGGAHVGGVVGCGVKAQWTYTNVSNTGNISLNFNKSNYAIFALGGVIGTGHGTFTDCFNKGSLTDTDGKAAKTATRRIGGFIGCSGEKGYPVNMTRCYNSGSVSAVGNYLGGFVGIAESAPAAAPNTFTDCYNTGNVTCESDSSPASQFGGFAGTLYNYASLSGCVNRGKVSGTLNSYAAGVVGRAGDNITLDRCENSGEIDIRVLDRGRDTFVAGLMVITGNSSGMTIRNSKNTGRVTAMVKAAEKVQSVYVCSSSDAVKCDDATREASAAAIVTPVLP